MVHKRPGMRRRLSLRDSSLSTGTTKRRMRASSARVGKAAASLVGASGGNVRRLAGSAAATSGSVRRLSASPLKPTQTVAALDAWDEIRAAAARQVAEQSWRSGDLHDFGIDSYLRSEVLDHQTLACGLSNSIGGKLVANQANDGGVDYNAILLSAFRADPQICDAVAADMQRFKVVDPACDGLLGVYLFYKGIQAIACARGESTRQTRSSALLPCVPPHCRHTTFIPRLTCFPQSRTTFGRHAAAQANSSPSSYSRRRPTVR